jgi:Flp pilus assembly pilin Flp
MKPVSHPLRNQKGQTLIEYLIIVALVGVGSIALMRAVSQNINAKFAGIVHALGGTVEGNRTAATVTENMYRKRDMKDFVNGAVNTKSNGKGNDSQGAN